MIRAQYLACAETIARDEHTNQISLINLVEEVRAAGFPAALPRLAVFVLLERDPGDRDVCEAELRLEANGEESRTLPLRVAFDGAMLNRTVIRVERLVVTQPGTLSFVFTVEGRVLASMSLRVAIAEPAHSPAS